MSHESPRSSKGEQIPTGAGHQSVDEAHGKRRPAWIPLQFGLIEFQSWLVSLALLYFILVSYLYDPPYRRYGPVPTAPILVRAQAFGLAFFWSVVGAYASNRFATRRRIYGVGRRVLLHVLCTFIVVPGLCLAVWMLIVACLIGVQAAR
jgi:hypothetical protein